MLLADSETLGSLHDDAPSLNQIDCGAMAFLSLIFGCDYDGLILQRCGGTRLSQTRHRCEAAPDAPSDPCKEDLVIWAGAVGFRLSQAWGPQWETSGASHKHVTGQMPWCASR
jgi:hypothetical protein